MTELDKAIERVSIALQTKGPVGACNIEDVRLIVRELKYFKDVQAVRPSRTHTSTFVTLQVSSACFNEIWDRLEIAEYFHCLGTTDDGRKRVVLGTIALEEIDEGVDIE